VCGRFAFFSPHEAVVAAFGADVPGRVPRWNVAPSQPVAVLRERADAVEAAMLRWGLVPSWARDRSIASRLINARAETIADKPAFRAAFRRRRCAVVADGFYEWQVAGTGKQPWFITTSDGRPMAMAGLWERCTLGGETLETCTIVTVPASRGLQTIHRRMPALLAPGAPLRQWLGLEPVADAAALLVPAPDGSTRAWRVDRRVNDPSQDDPGLISALDG